ncbi:hypothetical protein VitviT2T_002240 [Vitis vinifera]|uniref:DUF1639 domain-containing protein n=1 Tax=Vitis vinifera TaxID=29760 RepID=A0ABY9BI98_VITVI|nr:uncharacterized protein LOC100853295 [Vitis vinifera]XP_034690310.1 uncharacterized protein LOC117917927 [Vitis riparia]WJZ82483.1 hypothetical protein VitviT2T_002240 [Vitis vinifera]WJZ82484.1 hypothetical protein VitviT2T_002240 [Vitis vinifera]
MATAPVKSQPLHNFPLSFLKWGKNQMNNHRCRKPVDASRESPPDGRKNESEPDSDGGSKNESDSENRKLPLGSRTARSRHAVASPSPVEKAQKNQALVEREGGEVDEGEGEESVQKPWNLRPRKAVSKSPIEIGVAPKNGELQEAVPGVPHSENQPKSLRLRGFAESHSSEKKEKRKFWISLSREEIEEDIFVMTGSKPARRPKKRAKNVQKQLDNVFPGLWLVGVTPDSYRLPDAPAKR